MSSQGCICVQGRTLHHSLCINSALGHSGLCVFAVGYSLSSKC